MARKGLAALAILWALAGVGTGQEALPPGGEGLRGEYYIDRSFEELGGIRTDSPIDFTFGKEPPYRGGKLPRTRDGWHEHFTVRWTGRVLPRYSEEYTFHVTVDDGALVWIEDRLVVNAWKDQGATEYTGRIRLTAGKPAKIKLLYYNAWFGGSVKLSWSSASQRKEIVPKSRLFLPERPGDESKPADLPALDGRVKVETIDLPEPVQNDPRGKKPSLHLHPLKGGGFLLGWNDRKGALHLTRLTADLRAEDKEVKLPDLDLRGLAVHDDGSVALMAAQLPNRMCLLKLDAAGKQLFKTVLVGHQGRGEGAHFLDDHFSFTGRFLASGKQYAAHFAHSAHHGKGGVHQGGYFAVLDHSGKIVRENKWTVSHSLDQRLLAHRDAFLTLSAGDCFPKGLWFENRTLNVGRVIYPPPARREKFGNCAGFVNATLGSMVPVGSNVAITFLTKDGESQDVIYMLLEEDGYVLKTVKLTDTPKIDEQVVRLAPFGEHLLLAWQESEGVTKLALIDAQGRFRNRPTTIKEPLPQNDDLVALPNGDVVWLVGKTGDRQLRLVRVCK